MKIMSPYRLSHISEKSADDHLTVINDASKKKVPIPRRSSSVGNRQVRERVSSIMANASSIRSSLAGIPEASIRSNSVASIRRAESKQA